MASKQADRRKAAKQRDELCFRPLNVRAGSVNPDGRTVEAIISTENPVPMLDWDRYEVVPEVLRSDGAVIPTQIPLLDNHNRFSTADQLGSASEIARDGGDIIGKLRFSVGAEDQWNLVREGHITDVSAGYQVLEKTFVPRGATQKVMGSDYTGPVNVVTKWKLREVSLTPIGADEQAKLRGFDPSAFSAEKGFNMNEQLRSLLESRGMPKELADDEARQQWAVDNNFGEKKEEKPKGLTLDADMRKLIEESTTRAADEAARKAAEEIEKRRQAIRSQADTLLKISGSMQNAELRAACYECQTREQIEKLITDDQEKRSKEFPSGVSIRVTGEGIKEMESAMSTALAMRAMSSVGPTEGKRRDEALEKVYPKAERHAGAKDFERLSLYGMAETYVRDVMGFNVRDLNRDEVAIIALFGARQGCELLGKRDAGAYHTTGSFANLTLDAMHKSMMVGYTEAPSTWEGPMRRGAPAQDFKEIHRLRMGAIPNLPVWNDNSDPKKSSLADAREHYAVESRSTEIDFSYRLLVNDDLDALSRIPGMMGAAAKRTVNSVAWAQITSNPTMSDSVALFSGVSGNRKRSNLTTGVLAPSVANLQTQANLMRQMRGENTPEQVESADILNLQPRYIVGPGALATTIQQLVLSAYDPAANSFMVYNTATQLIPVIEPLLDVASTTAWYLFADPSQIDTVEVSFLQGQESPAVRNYLDPKRLSQSWTILQTFAAKSLNHRGMIKANNV